MSKIFELVRPKSLTDAAYANFEYLIRWMGRDGSEYLWMFYDAELSTELSSEVINSEDPARLQSLVAKVGQSITLTADDLSASDLVILGQILENRYVTRLLKSGSVERYAPDASGFKYRLMDGRYVLELVLVAVDIKTWK